MKIDWFTLTAQIVNFLVLVWLLKRFLYGPIIRTMDEREQKLADRQAQADASKRDAEHEADEFRRKMQELEHTREELLAQAAREVEVWKSAHLQRVRADADHSRDEWYRSINRERAAFLQDLRRRAGAQVHSLARQVLAKLCNTPLEREIIESFLHRLQHIDEQQRSDIAAVVGNSHNKILIETAFELADDDRDRIRSTIREHVTDTVDVEFKIVPELICGIELKAAGYKVAWSAGETLDELEDEFTTALNEAVS